MLEIAGNIICVMSVLDVCCAKITWPELQNVTERRNWTLLMRTRAIFTQCVDGECLAGRNSDGAEIVGHRESAALSWQSLTSSPV